MAGKYHPKYTAEFNGDRLKEIRQKQGLTQEVFAERWGWGGGPRTERAKRKRTIRSLEKGKCTNPSATLLCKMASVLEVSAETLMKISVVSETDA